jgi:putative transposase
VSRGPSGLSISPDQTESFGLGPTRGNDRRKINLSLVFAGHVGIKQVIDEIWLVSFMDYDLGYFDQETCRLEPIENPFGPKVLPMSPE